MTPGAFVGIAAIGGLAIGAMAFTDSSCTPLETLLERLRDTCDQVAVQVPTYSLGRHALVVSTPDGRWTRVEWSNPRCARIFFGTGCHRRVQIG